MLPRFLGQWSFNNNCRGPFKNTMIITPTAPLDIVGDTVASVFILWVPFGEGSSVALLCTFFFCSSLISSKWRFINRCVDRGIWNSLSWIACRLAYQIAQSDEHLNDLVWTWCCIRRITKASDSSSHHHKLHHFMGSSRWRDPLWPLRNYNSPPLYILLLMVYK